MTHRHLMMFLHMMAIYDQLNLLTVAAAEFASRRVLMIQRAVRLNFGGLGSRLTHALGASGGVVAERFDAEMAEMRRTQAEIMRSDRLWKEERTDSKRQKTSDDDKNKSGPRGGSRGP